MPGRISLQDSLVAEGRMENTVSGFCLLQEISMLSKQIIQGNEVPTEYCRHGQEQIKGREMSRGM